MLEKLKSLISVCIMYPDLELWVIKFGKSTWHTFILEWQEILTNLNIPASNVWGNMAAILKAAILDEGVFPKNAPPPLVQNKYQFFLDILPRNRQHWNFSYLHNLCTSTVYTSEWIYLSSFMPCVRWSLLYLTQLQLLELVLFQFDWILMVCDQTTRELGLQHFCRCFFFQLSCNPVSFSLSLFPVCSC